MKICHIVPKLNTTGGIQTFANEVCTQQVVRRNVEVKKLDFKHEIGHHASLIFDLSPDFFKKMVSDTLIVPPIRKQFLIDKFDLFHAWHVDAAMYLPKRSKFVLTVHGLEILDETINSSWFRKTYVKNAIDNASIITCDSNYTKELLAKRFSDVDRSKLRIIYPPISYNKYRYRNRKKSIRKVVGTLSRFVYRKNIIRIIDAISMLHNEIPNLVFHLAGNGELKDEILSKLEKANFEWKYFGEINNNDKRNVFFPGLDVFVMPTFQTPTDVEGFGIVYLEANASGVPVIGARSGGSTEAIYDGHTGVFADPHDVADIAKKIRYVLMDKHFEVQEMRAWAKSFDISACENEFNNVYREIL